jgi:hypothetical protein
MTQSTIGPTDKRSVLTLRGTFKVSLLILSGVGSKPASRFRLRVHFITRLFLRASPVFESVAFPRYLDDLGTTEEAIVSPTQKLIQPKAEISAFARSSIWPQREEACVM